jgi:excinuclease UvrABC ATPase subunit
MTIESNSSYLATVTVEAFCFVPVSSGDPEKIQREILENGLPEGCEWQIQRNITNVERIELTDPAHKAVDDLIKQLRNKFPSLKDQELQALAAKKIESLLSPGPGKELLESIFGKLSN